LNLIDEPVFFIIPSVLIRVVKVLFNAFAGQVLKIGLWTISKILFLVSKISS